MSQGLTCKAAIKQLQKGAEAMGYNQVAQQAGLSGSSAVIRALTMGDDGVPRTTVRTLGAIARALGYSLRVTLEP